jgi:cytochrome P450
MTLYLAGHETTALTLAWSWYLLSQHPHVEDKLLSEWRRVLGGATPTTQHLPKLTFWTDTEARKRTVLARGIEQKIKETGAKPGKQVVAGTWSSVWAADHNTFTIRERRACQATSLLA